MVGRLIKGSNTRSDDGGAAAPGTMEVGRIELKREETSPQSRGMGWS